MADVLRIFRRVAECADSDAAWAALGPALAALTIDEIVALDYRLTFDAADLGPRAVPTLKRRVVEYLLQRKLAAFVYDCFNPFVNPWVLQERMKALFWRIEFARSLSEQLEEIAEAHKLDPDVPWTVTGNLFGMANAALLAWQLGGWDDTIARYGQGETPPALDFRPGTPAMDRGQRAG
jgi:hypothetical protein